MTIIGGVR